MSVKIDTSSLPKFFPTHLHSAEFWESLGRTVATYGFLEENLGKAIFVLTGTKPYDPSEIEVAYQKWAHKIQCALTDTLKPLITSYENGLREHPAIIFSCYIDLISHLKACVDIRNVICHGSWGMPDENGFCTPLFVDKKLNEFTSLVDYNYLNQVQQHIAELSCLVINSVTENGLPFPGSSLSK
jgi:hypothetical protein